MKKMTVMIAAYNSASAERVIKRAKENFGLKKGARVLKANGAKVIFVSGLIQKTVKDLSELDKYKDYDMLVIPAYPEDFDAKPNTFDAKVHVNNNLGFSVFVCGVQKSGREEDVKESADFLCEIIRNNLGL
ncbi:MAG: hypothetical protein AB7E96_10785 [Deferribacterales bacterium]